MRRFHGFRLAVLLSALTATPSLADAIADCTQDKDARLRIAGCGILLQSGALADTDKALVLRFRGQAYQKEKEWQKALADFDQMLDHVTGEQFLGAASVVILF